MLRDTSYKYEPITERYLRFSKNNLICIVYFMQYFRILETGFKRFPIITASVANSHNYTLSQENKIINKYTDSKLPHLISVFLQGCKIQ